MVKMGISYVKLYSISSGILAIVPSSFMISQMTPAIYRSARRVISIAASVWPALSRTPPFMACRGKMCPGRAISEGFVLGSMAVRIVLALSKDDIPVVIPSLASIETVKAV